MFLVLKFILCIRRRCRWRRMKLMLITFVQKRFFSTYLGYEKGARARFTYRIFVTKYCINLNSVKNLHTRRTCRGSLSKVLLLC